MHRTYRPPHQVALLLPLLVLLCACGSAPRTGDPLPSTMPAAGTVLGQVNLDFERVRAILELDAENVSAEQIVTVLADAPAPQVIAIYGGVVPGQDVMESFADFLVGMGYPADHVRNHRDGSCCYSGYVPSGELAGYVAWFWEQDAMRPMLVGHSLGGMQAVKVLHELNGGFSTRLSVWNPTNGRREDRETVRDPFSGRETPVLGLDVSYTSVLASGGIARLFPQQWDMFGRLRSIPDTTSEFTGYHLRFDPVGGDLLGLGTGVPYNASGSNVKVRTMELPLGNNHFLVPDTRHLVHEQATRDWIDAYRPQYQLEEDDPMVRRYPRITWAADVWYSIKKHWVLELQRLARSLN